MLISNNQIILRRLEPDDIDTFFAYRSDPDVGRFQDWSTMSRSKTERFLHHVNSSPLFQWGEWSQIAIAQADSNTLLGDLGIRVSENGQRTELGITLSKPAQGHGIAEMACRLAFDLIWDHTPAQDIRIWTLKANLPAQALCKRLKLEDLGLETTTLDTGEIVEEFAYRLARPTST